MKKSNYLLYLTLSTLFFLSACGGVPEEGEEASEKKIFSISEVFEMLAFENDVTRTAYTKIIVGELKKQGLNFDEDWRKSDIEAGPLPALFLRGVSSDISRKKEVPLGLYLGSDFPINDANKFVGKQAELFHKIKEDLNPQFFFDEANQTNTAMFADVAHAPACVSCHNEHPQTTKKDWKLGDVMGATTWQYPKDSLSYTETIQLLNAYRDGVKSIYGELIDEVTAFKTSEKPEIGKKWPSEGFYLPTAETFLDSVMVMTSYKTMSKLRG